ncbi:hypothetical protein [Streptomyces sp. NPDC060198]|uniref:hypothetical protein n=1 Tax=Streptomyces sp. NPDC060198 TaxID=3347070 RepID=UPI00364BC542
MRGHDRSAVVLWIGGQGDDPDRVYALRENGHRRVPVFVTVRQARLYAGRRGRPAVSGADVLELFRVQHWLEDPVRRKLPPGAVLDTWNFSEDLARGLGASDRLPEQGAVHDSAYEKLFGDQCAAWTTGEHRAVVELMAAGVELWSSCPVAVNPRSVVFPGGGQGLLRYA